MKTTFSVIGVQEKRNEHEWNDVYTTIYRGTNPYLAMMMTKLAQEGATFKNVSMTVSIDSHKGNNFAEFQLTITELD